MRFFFLLLAGGFLTSLGLFGQRQYSDTLYAPPEFPARYAPGTGPRVLIDSGHHNFHTLEGRYRPCGNVLALDGFRVGAFPDSLTGENLAAADVLLISNALAASSLGNWVAPTASAFTPREIATLEDWVAKGGRLFLIADHMPMAGAAKELAAAFGFTFHDGFADDTSTVRGPEIFSLEDGTLAISPLTKGGDDYFSVPSVATFTGQAFQIPEGAVSLLRCGDTWITRLPTRAWQFDENTPTLNSAGWSQGAIMEYGRGKLVVFGEAAMFTAQVVEIDNRTIRAGMNSRPGKNNYRLLLNLVRWLTE